MLQLDRIDKVVGIVLKSISGFCLIGLFALLLINVTARSLDFTGFAWFDEIVKGLFAWMVFIGAAALWREGQHFRVDWLQVVLGEHSAGQILTIFISLLSLSFLATMTLYGYDLMSRSAALTPILDLPTSLFYAAIPISAAIMTLYELRELCIAIASFSTKKEIT